MPVIKVQTNHKNVSDGFEVRLAICMARVMQRPESQIFVTLETNTRMTRGQLTDPLAVLEVTTSTPLTPELAEHYTTSICEFFGQELLLDSDAVLINFRSIDAYLIGFNGHILSENRPFWSAERVVIAVLAAILIGFVVKFFG